MKKKVLSLLLSALLTCSALTGTLSAADTAPNTLTTYNGTISTSGVYATSVDGSIPGEIIAGGVDASTVAAVFDGNIASDANFGTNYGTDASYWIGIKTAEPVLPTAFRLSTADTTEESRSKIMGSFIQASEDGVNWVTLKEFDNKLEYQEPQTKGGWWFIRAPYKIVEVDCDTTYSYFRYFNYNGKGGNTLSEFQVFAKDDLAGNWACEFGGEIVYAGVPTTSVDGSLIGEAIGAGGDAATIAGLADGDRNTTVNLGDQYDADVSKWMGVVFPRPVTATEIRFIRQEDNRNYCIFGGYIQASEDGVNWKTIDVIDGWREYAPSAEGGNWEKGTYKVIPMTLEGEYRYFRFFNYEEIGDNDLAEFHVYGTMADPEPEYIPGDINMDGSINISDALTLFQHSLMGDLYPVTYPAGMDYTMDGSLDIADALYLFQHSLMPDLYPLPDGTAPETTNNTITLGSLTAPSGDFRFPGYGTSAASSADLDIATLIEGYSTMEINAEGEYVWNDTAVKSHSEEIIQNSDGTQNYKVTIEINEGLTFSDGTPVTADNYLAYLLAFSTVVAQKADGTGMVGQAFVGYEDYFNYGGEGFVLNGEAPATKEFAGIRKLSDYSFSLEINGAAGYYPHFYAYTYSVVTPYDLGLILGDGVTVKDDGNGCYLDGNWYEQTAESTAEDPSFVKSAHMMEARYDTSKYPVAGPYVITEWDMNAGRVTLTKNANFAGNFEGQKPSVETVIYTNIGEIDALELLKNGEIDVLSGITDSNAIDEALQLVGEGFAENHYPRAGYGKIQFDCDFGPTMFTEVRRALTALLDRATFASTFTGGYGKVVDGPYSEDSWMYVSAKETLQDSLDTYQYSLAEVKTLLAEAGWVYNSKGEAYAEGADGVDKVRYKKVTAEELETLTTADAANATIAYRSVNNLDGITYQTVEIDGAYYIPCVINWFSTEDNPISDLILTMLADNPDTAAAGIVIRQTQGDFGALLSQLYREPAYGFDGNITYGMYNLATGFNSPIYDYSYNWSLDPTYFAYSADKLYDEYDRAFPYDPTNRLSYAEAMEASDGKLGMDYLSMAMVYSATTNEEYLEWWTAYIQRWNQLMPEIPLYSNLYYDFYNAKIQNYATSPYWNAMDAVIYCSIAD